MGVDIPRPMTLQWSYRQGAGEGATTMQTATAKTASHYIVMGDTHDGFITLDVSDTMQDALEYRDLNRLTDAEVWVVFTDATSDRIA